MSMKILYIVSTLKGTGPINQLYGIIHNLDRNKFTPYIITLSNEPQNSKKKLFEDDHVEIKTLGLSRIAFILWGKKILKKFITENSPDLIHTSGIRADTVMSTLNINIPLCSTLRNYVFEDYIPLFGRIRGTLMAIWHETAIKKMENPICCSKTLREKYSKHLNKEFFVIQNGVDTQQYCVKNQKDRLCIRKRLKLPLDKKIIIVAGDIIERKDPVTIINAIEQIKEKNKFQLIFIGDGMLKEKLQKHESPYIKFLGHKNNVSEYFQAADFFVSASKSEGLPNTVLEAGACGMPMILSGIPQHREVFEKDISGISFFNVQNAAMLSQAICIYLENCKSYSRFDIGTYIKERFDSRKMSNKYQNFYKKCIGDQS